MIGSWLALQDDAVLERLAHISASQWDSQQAWREPGETGGCLLCHAFNCRTEDEYISAVRADGGDGWRNPGWTEDRYMELCARFGDARVGRAISERAMKLLRERRLDAWRNRPKGISEREATAYVREHVTSPEGQAVPC